MIYTHLGGFSWVGDSKTATSVNSLPFYFYLFTTKPATPFTNKYLRFKLCLSWCTKKPSRDFWSRLVFLQRTGQAKPARTRHTPCRALHAHADTQYTSICCSHCFHKLFNSFLLKHSLTQKFIIKYRIYS